MPVNLKGPVSAMAFDFPTVAIPYQNIETVDALWISFDYFCNIATLLNSNRNTGNVGWSCVKFAASPITKILGVRNTAI